MTASLARALEAVRGLPDDEQDRIAAIVFEEIEDSAAWDRSFAAAPERLSQFGDEAEAEYLRGETEILDPERV